jgi:anaerobic selenocysteine-containing dehydrogenase
LPAASFLERDLILNYRYRPLASVNVIALQNQCVPPVGESKSDLDFIFALARRVSLGEHFPWQKMTDAFDWELEANDINVAWLRANPGGYVRKYSDGEIYRKYEKEGFPTPSKKIELVSSRFEEKGFDPLPTYVEPAISPLSRPDLAREYPLICSTGLKLGIHTHTQFRTLPWIRELEPDPFAEIHPATAAESGIKEGEWVSIESPKGAMKARARLRIAERRHESTRTAPVYGPPENGGGDTWLWRAIRRERRSA